MSMSSIIVYIERSKDSYITRFDIIHSHVSIDPNRCSHSVTVASE